MPFIVNEWTLPTTSIFGDLSHDWINMLHETRCFLAAVKQQIKNSDAVGKLSPKLGVFGVARIIEPSQFDAALGKFIHFDVVLGRGAGNIFCCSSLRAEINKTLGLSVDQDIVPRIADLGRNA